MLSSTASRRGSKDAQPADRVSRHQLQAAALFISRQHAAAHRDRQKT